MTRICNHCRRVNPREAVFCYFDGAFLDDRAGGVPANGTALDIGARAFPNPLVFPSGRVCHNFNELALACAAEPAAALDLLRRGVLESFLGALGRTDLARAARPARSGDPERGLDDFLGRLPGSILTPARLHVEPAVIDLGTLRRGKDHRCELMLVNQGRRLLYGSASRDNSPWLSLGDKAIEKRKLFQFCGHFVLPLRILGDRLRANARPQQAEVRLESNGGTVTVMVRVQVPVEPFPEGLLTGAASPRQAAAQMVTSPHQAAALLESGAVARWYRANGWDYPIPGPTASGLAAVQQFLEALGLSQPPRVELGTEAIRLSGGLGEGVEYVLPVVAQQNRAAIAFATSDQPWLRIGPTIFRGRSAFVPLTVPAVPACPGQSLQAQVTVIANGGQRFLVPVTLEVRPAGAAARSANVAVQQVAQGRGDQKKRAPRRATKGLAALPPIPPASPTPTAVPPEAQYTLLPAPSHGPGIVQRTFRALMILVCLVSVGALGVLGWRLYQEKRGSDKPAPPPPDPGPILTIAFQDDPKDKAVGAATMTFGLALPREHKRLLFDPRGRTNNTCYRLDGKEFLLGYEGAVLQKLPRQLSIENGGKGRRTVWLHGLVAFIQNVEVTTRPQSGQPDTCRVRYTIENRDATAHKIGLRVLLDTFIGSRDGVPFLVPGLAARCDTSCDLQGAKVPDFLEALETDNLKAPGIVAHLGLRPGGGVEAPGRVTIAAWPDAKLQTADPRAQGNLTRWEVPLLSLKAQADSAVTLYWLETDLKPGAHRELGFTYGPGSLTGSGGDGRLALAAGGTFSPGSDLTLIALVKNPAAAETLTLEGAPGWALTSGQAITPVPPLAAGTWPISLVTWKVRPAPGATSGRLRVISSTGQAQELSVTLRTE